MKKIRRFLRRFLISVPCFFFWLRSVYLNVVTFGAWGKLGNFTLDLAESHWADRDRNDRTEHRLDGFMRFVETDLQVVIPGDIEPPRLTSFGEGLSTAEEFQIIRAQQERLGKPIPCPNCDGSGVVMVAAKATLTKKGLERPLLPQACRRCTGSGVISAADSEAGEVQVPEQGGSDDAPGGAAGG